MIETFDRPKQMDMMPGRGRRVEPVALAQPILPMSPERARRVPEQVGLSEINMSLEQARLRRLNQKPKNPYFVK